MRNLKDLARELRRRHVFKVAGAYALVGWIVIQAADILVPQLQLPAWLAPAVTMMVLLGFPLALVLAWAYDITPEGIRATGAAEAHDLPEGSWGAVEPASEEERAQETEVPQPKSDPSRTGRTTRPVQRQAVVAVGVLTLLSVAAAGWIALRGASGAGVPTGEALLVQIEALAAEERFEEAFTLAESAQAEGEELAPGTWATVADRVTVITEPAGARIRALRFDPERGEAGADGEWLELGSTPVHGRAVPRGDYLVRVEREGYEATERLASTALHRMEGRVDDRTAGRVDEVPEALLRIRLAPEGTVPEGMVPVPGGPYSIASRNLQGLLANLDDFYLDRYEVTNARFAEFVAAGGYLDRSHWTGLFDDDRIPDPDAALRGFTDRTGLPGPREWSGQQFRRGEQDHPVTGVSWYEAAAYCSFRDARLPTVFEWEKAARDGEIVYTEGVFMPWGPLHSEAPSRPRANFSGEGTMPVGAHPFGLSPYGAHDMAGNVKEWLRNATETGRAVTGGSWEDPIYMFSEVGSADPTVSSPSLGFRCARRVDGRAGRAIRGARDTDTQGARPLQVAVETPDYQPVGDEAFSGLLSHYAYDRRAVHGSVVERLESSGWVRERIVFDGAGEDEVIAYLYLPVTGRPPYQVLAYVPGSDAFLGSRVSESAEWLLGPVIRSGRAVFVVVMEGMTERPFPPDWELPASNSARFRDLMVHHATELRMGLDYLESRDDVDMDALGYVGLSWGAGSRLVFAAVDDRYRAVIFVGGGIDERVQPTLPEASNINFAPRISAPVLLLNGREDEEHLWLTRGLPLWNLLSDPKELVLVQGAGHVPPLEARIPAIGEFLDRHLGPVRR